MRALHTARSRVFAAVLAAVLTLLGGFSAAPAYADEPLGGPKLGGHGIVVDPAAPPLPDVTAQGWLIADLDTGAVLASRNPHGKFLPASTLKTLTALALLPRLNPKTVVKPSNAAANIDGTKVGIEPGFPVSIDLLFTGMLIYSGNDTATALAEAAGGEDLTVSLMNEQAKRLQADDTKALNPTGLDADGQVSSPYDLALMGRAALKIDAYRRYTGTRQATIPSHKGPFQIANKNRLLYNYPGTFGGKTGGTTKALQTYIGYAARDGHRLVLTIMKTNFWRVEAPKLLDWGFAAVGKVTPVGSLVEPLDAAGLPGSVSTVTPATGTKAKAGVTSGKSAAKSGGFKLPGLPHGKWWFVGVPALVAVFAVLRTLRRRRRRRRGFYMPETKLRLPVR